MKLKNFEPRRLRSRVLSQLLMLALQFILGMVLNLSPARHVLYNVVLVIHILNALGLVEGGIYIALREKSSLAWKGTIAVTLTLLMGVLTLYLKPTGLWSFLMATGFLLSSWIYILLYIKADRRLR